MGVTKERWLAERRSDPWHRKAKEEGYPSRAAYKLIFIQQKYHVIKRGDLVVDLGSWPGGMLAVESQTVGPEGLVVAVDLKEPAFRAENVVFLRMDVNDADAPFAILSALGNRRCDVLVSDVSPKFTGVRDVDVFNQLMLGIRALEISDVVLRRGGNVVIKFFECEELPRIERRLRNGFRFLKRVITPPTLRKNSSELFLVGIGKLTDRVSDGLAELAR